MPTSMDITIAYSERFGHKRERTAREVGHLPFETYPHPDPPFAYRGRQSFVTDGWVSSTGASTSLASLRQHRVALELDRDRDIAAFSAGPIELRWACLDGSPGALRPPFIARTTGGRRLVVVIVPDAVHARWYATIQVVAEAARQAGWGVRTVEVPQGARLANLLRAARARDPRRRDPAQARAVLDAFPGPRILAEGIAGCGLPRLVALEVAWHLIWTGRLGIDWDSVFVPTRSLAWAVGDGP